MTLAEQAHQVNAGLTYAGSGLAILAFALLVFGVMRLAAPTPDERPAGRALTAGSGIAVVAALLTVYNVGAAPSEEQTRRIGSFLLGQAGGNVDVPLINWLLLAGGLAAGVGLGIRGARPAAGEVLALSGALTGGAAALTACARFLATDGFVDFTGEGPASPSIVGLLIAALLGAMSGAGSLAALLARRGNLPGGVVRVAERRAVLLQRIDVGLIVIALALAVFLAVRAWRGDGASTWFMAALLLVAAAAGKLAVLPRLVDDLPRIQAVLTATAGLSVAALGIALDSTVLIVAGMLVAAAGVAARPDVEPTTDCAEASAASGP